MKKLAEVLKNKGFEVEVDELGITVSLNRNISFMEVEMASNYKAKRHNLVRISDNSIIIASL